MTSTVEPPTPPLRDVAAARSWSWARSLLSRVASRPDKSGRSLTQSWSFSTRLIKRTNKARCRSTINFQASSPGNLPFCSSFVAFEKKINTRSSTRRSFSIRFLKLCSVKAFKKTANVRFTIGSLYSGFLSLPHKTPVRRFSSSDMKP